MACLENLTLTQKSSFEISKATENVSLEYQRQDQQDLLKERSTVDGLVLYS